MTPAVLGPAFNRPKASGGFMAIPVASRDRLLNKQQLKTKTSPSICWFAIPY
jgi:hypothetical protein